LSMGVSLNVMEFRTISLCLMPSGESTRASLGFAAKLMRAAWSALGLLLD
jgi:hypothetical protein